MSINSQFTADFTAFIDAAHGAQSALGGVVGMSETIAPSVSKAAYAAGQQFARFGEQVVGVGKEFVESYASEQAATEKLKAALEAQGKATGGVVEGYKAMATQFQTNTKYSDDAILGAQTLFTTIGHVGPEAMEPAIQAATDLASGMGISLPSAARMLAQAMGSGGESLGRLNAILGDTAPKGKSAADILDAVHSKFGGQAAADMKTYTGQLESLDNQFGDVSDTIGGVLVSVLQPMLELFRSLPAPLQTTIAAVGVVGTALLPLAIAAGSLVTALTPLVALLGGTAGIAGGLAAVGAAIGVVIVPLGLLVAAIGAVWVAWRNWDAIKALVADVYNAVYTYMQQKLGAVFDWLGGKIEAVTGFFKSMADKVALHSYVPDMVGVIADEFGKLPTVMVAPAEDAAAKVTAALASARSALTGASAATGVAFKNPLPVNLAQAAFGPGFDTDPTVRAMLQKGYTLSEAMAVAGGYGTGILGGGGIQGGRDRVDRAQALAGAAVTINVYGSVLSTSEQLAGTVGSAVSDAYSASGRRVPV